MTDAVPANEAMMLATPPPPTHTEMDFTKTTKYVCNKKRVLLPPPPPGVLASLFLFIKRVAALPYLFLVSVLTFDLLLLERWVGWASGHRYQFTLGMHIL